MGKKKLSEEEKLLHRTANNARYRSNHRERIRESQRRWKRENGEKVREKDRIYYLDNRKKIAARQQAYHAANRELQRQRNWRQKGASMPTRPEPQSCECCGGPPKGKSNKHFALDHCHVTGKFRGWLCGNCNSGIGKLGDTYVTVMRAAAYLLKADEIP